MEEDKQKKEKDCPLCEVSEDTLEKLRKEQPKKEVEIEKKDKKKSFWKLKVWIFIFIFVTASFGFYQLAVGGNSAQKQAGEKSQASILDTIFGGGIKIGDLAPDFTSEDVYGNRVSLTDFQGEKPVLLVFWATWCGYCAKELPDLKVFAEEYQDEVKVIAVPSGENKETIRDYIQEKDVNFLMLLDQEKEIWNKYLARGTPSHFLISSQGKIITLRPGLASKEDLEIMMTMLAEL